MRLPRRFIFAFGAAGAFTFLTAATGLAGVSWNSRALLGLYSVLLVLMLIAQVRVRVPCLALPSHTCTTKLLLLGYFGEFSGEYPNYAPLKRLWELASWAG